MIRGPVFFETLHGGHRCFKKQSPPNFSENQHFLPPDTHTYVCVSGGNKCSFFGKFGVLCFLETPVLKFPFALLPAICEITEPFEQ